MNKSQLRALQYVLNTGESVTVAQFDDDNDPIGGMLRADLMPRWITEVDGVLKLTAEGRAALETGENHA